MSKHASAKSPSQRQLRLGELIRHAFAEIFLRADFHDPDLRGVSLTVTEVRVSPDARNASVFLLPLGGENQDAVIAALSRHRKFLRGELAHAIRVKYTPDITFKLDESFDESDRIEELLRSPEVAADLKDD